MKNSVIAIQSFVITIIVYALLVPIFFEMDNAFRGENFVDNNDNDNTTSGEQEVETTCKSPCPSNSEMCITMCA